MNKPSILKKIFNARRTRVEEEKREADLPRLIGAARQKSRDRPIDNFKNAIAGRDRINVIAEIKRASPSLGLIKKDLDVRERVREYERNGAAAVSVLTESDHFMGDLDDLLAARAACSLPILRKDFIFDAFQIYQSGAAGADAVLLIASMLDDTKLSELFCLAKELNINVLVEVHNKDELGRADKIGAGIIGVNNRDLNTFEVSIDLSRNLIQSAPEGAIMVSESGLHRVEDVLALKKLGFDAFLIGEALMRDDRNASFLKELVSEAV